MAQSDLVLNAAMDTERARKRRPVQPYPELDDESWQPPTGVEADPERIAVHAERSRAIADALTHITDDQRAAIVLYDVEGYDYGEIAEMTGVSLGTVSRASTAVAWRSEPSWKTAWSCSVAEEPTVPPARLTDDMTDPRPAACPDHASHDLVLVAEAADRDGRFRRPRRLCGLPGPPCRSANPDRRDSDRRSPDAAAFLHPHAGRCRATASRWRRRWIAAIGTSRDTFTRPLAIGLTTMGLAGLLVATVPGALTGVGSSAGAAAEAPPEGGEAVMSAPAAGAPSQAPVPGVAAPAMGAPTRETLDMSAAPEFQGAADGGTDTGNARTETTPPSVDTLTVLEAPSGAPALLIVAGALLLVGLGLFALRWGARRFGD